MSSKEIGSKQREILVWLCKYGSWYEHCGWLFGSHHKTINLLESLLKRGLVSSEVRRRGTLKAITVYKPTEEAFTVANVATRTIEEEPA